MRRRTLAVAFAAVLAAAPAAFPQDGRSDAEAALVAKLGSSQGGERAAVAAELGRLYESEERWSEAAAAWREARKLRGDLADLEGEARAVLGFAEEVLASGESSGPVAAAFEDARIALRRARAAGSKSADVALGFARCAEVGGETPARLAELASAHQALPEDLRVSRAFAAALRDSGDAVAARDLLAKLSDAHPGDAALALEWFSAARAADDEPQQLRALKRAATAAPDDVAPWSAVWQMYAGRQRWGELADATTDLAKACEDGGWAARYAGIACSMARRYDEALAWLEKAWQLRRTDSVARSEAARILMTEKKDRATAIRYYVEALHADPASARASEGLFFLARRYSDEGDPKAAVPLFEAIARARPDDAVAQNNYANSLRFAGRYADSERTYLAAIERFPGDAQLRNDYALLLDVVGRDDDAVAALEGGHAADPANNDSMENLGFLAREKGRTDEALRWFRRAHAALVARGENDHKHRVNVDDQRWPLPPLR